ncbi:arrestin domain-containing protein [Metarhizium guizhouense ARSEF 977]|uniref:ATP-dependent DNA helicase n=1 Tax=Metarhizium guizhouense (strain ARSEF 977) TaxID=1276136 RepID=A0A0B4GMX3_METGA|nr:arrestin domain-containing protein [Metarhizium guizhouense ARSEF 977]
MRIEADLGEAATLGRSLAPRRSDGREQVQTETSQQAPAVPQAHNWRTESDSRKRKSQSEQSSRPLKQRRSEAHRCRSEDEQSNDLKAVLQWLEDEFQEKRRLSSTIVWCQPVSLERKVRTVQQFYQAMHERETLPIRTCSICYRKYADNDLGTVSWAEWQRLVAASCRWTAVLCSKCFQDGADIRSCRSCAKQVNGGVVPPAAILHRRLGCEHTFPEELKDLTPVEEKLIALNSCYGFFTKHTIATERGEAANYPKHIKGHITVFPNNVKELVSNVLPHPLLRVMEEVHVSWYGTEKPLARDLAGLLSVRRRKVEEALLWLKCNNPHYKDIEIDSAEMESWGADLHGVPPQILERVEQIEPTAWEKIQTAQIVPPTELCLDEDKIVGIEDILTSLSQAEKKAGGSCLHDQDQDSDQQGGVDMPNERHEEEEEKVHEAMGDPVIEIHASGMFALDGRPEVTDTEKLRFTYEAIGRNAGRKEAEKGGKAAASATLQFPKDREPFIQVSRGDHFADKLDTWFFPKAFPTLFPWGSGGPLLADEALLDIGGNSCSADGAETGAAGLLASRNMSLRTWADVVLRRHGGRFANHRIFAFLVFNLELRSRNRRASLLSVSRRNFCKIERVVGSLSKSRLDAATRELQENDRTSDEDIQELLKGISLYGFRQPMSRELRLCSRRKIKSLIFLDGMPAIWFTLNPNDLSSPVKLRLAAYRTHDPEDAEAFLTSLDMAFKRARLAVSDPMSSALFFHREISLFFEHYVRIGEDSVFGRISQYFGAVETNERGALHIHGLLWLKGNMELGALLTDLCEEGQAAYREQVSQYADSVFSEELDQAASSATQAERSVTSDASALLSDTDRFTASFDDEANFCAGATQVHTHSPTCVKYSFGRRRNKAPTGLCRFGAPWKIVEKTGFMEDGVLRIRRTHPTVNRWNKAIAVGLRHNHDISFIATQTKAKAIVYYVTNYATKLEDPLWKRAAAASAIFSERNLSNESAGTGVSSDEGAEANNTRRFMVRVANRVFTERPLSQVEVIANLLGYSTEFSGAKAWTFLNVSMLYRHIVRVWSHLQDSCGSGAADEDADGAVIVEEAGRRLSYIEAYSHRGACLRQLCLYDYMSLVIVRRRPPKRAAWGEIPFQAGSPFAREWIQVLRRPGQRAVVCIDGFLSVDFNEKIEGSRVSRAAVQHLALFVPWESFLSVATGDIDGIWRDQQKVLSGRIRFVVDNVQLLRQSAEDAKRDAKQWAASSGEGDPSMALDEPEHGELQSEDGPSYRGDSVGEAQRLVDVVSSARNARQITAGSKELANMVQKLSRFQQEALCSTDELHASCVVENGTRRVGQGFGHHLSGAKSASKEVERLIQGIQTQSRMVDAESCPSAPARHNCNDLDGDVQTTGQPSADPSVSLQWGTPSSFLAEGERLCVDFTLNSRQRVALLLICRHLDRIREAERESDVDQLCQFIGGEGGTGKSRIIKAIIELFARKGMQRRVLVTATSGTAAARVDGITIHSACNFSAEQRSASTLSKRLDGVQAPGPGLRFVSGQSRMVWQDKHLLIVDEVSMLGARTLFGVNEQLQSLRGSPRDFGGIPIIVFCGDFHQFRPVQERSILLSSTMFSWDQDATFRLEQRHQHDAAHRLWKKFSTVVMLNEQVRAAGDFEFLGLLTRIRQGSQTRADLDLLNDRCYKEGRRIPWETGIIVVTPLNRNRWNLNMEATIAFQEQRRCLMRIFLSEHKWRNGPPTEEEAITMQSQGDDSSTPVPAIFMFVPGMPIVVNQNTHQGLKLVNGSSYTAVDVILDKSFPGYRISADTILHFGPPAGIILTADSTKTFHFVDMPQGTILLTPLSAQMPCQRNRPWQRTSCTRRGLPCAAAFACTDYKVQGRTLERVALELRGTRTTNINGQAVPVACDPCSLYVQLSRCRTLDGIMLLSKVRERDFVGNTAPENMVMAQNQLEELSEKTIAEFEAWLKSINGSEILGACKT